MPARMPRRTTAAERAALAQQIRKLYEPPNPTSIRAIAETLGYSYATIHKRLHESGATVRPPNGTNHLARPGRRATQPTKEHS
jgi:transposase-like protein